MMFPLVRDLATEGIPVVVICGVLGVTPQAFYKWRRAPVNDREWVDAHDPEFGYRFIADELEATGHDLGEGRVHRLCRQNRVWSATTKHGRKGSGKRPGPAVHDDLVRRNFTASRIDEVWLTDITEHPTLEGKLYCCAIKGVFSNRTVGYAIDERMTAQLATSALRAAIARRRPAGTVVVHSDRGSQFRSRAFRAVLAAAELTGSIGRVAAAGDNAVMESFLSLLRKNVLDRRRWRTRAELRYAIVYWIEQSYNRRRRKRAPRQAHACRVRTHLRQRGGAGSMISHNRCQPNSGHIQEALAA